MTTQRQGTTEGIVIPDEPEINLQEVTETPIPDEQEINMQEVTETLIPDEPEITVEVTEDGKVDVVTIDHYENLHTRRQLRGAAIAGGLTGLVLGGPLVGVVAAGGAALAVSSKKGKVGVVARAGGEAVANVGDRLRQWPENHPQTLEKASKQLEQSRDWMVKRFTPRPDTRTSTRPSAGAMLWQKNACCGNLVASCGA